MAKAKAVVARVAAVRVRVTPQTNPQKQGTRLAAVEAIMLPRSPVAVSHLQKGNKL